MGPPPALPTTCAIRGAGFPTERLARAIASGATAGGALRHRSRAARRVPATGSSRVEAEAPCCGGRRRAAARFATTSASTTCATQTATTRTLPSSGRSSAADDLVPPARVRQRAGTESRARLRLRLPEGWRAACPTSASRRRHATRSRTPSAASTGRRAGSRRAARRAAREDRRLARGGRGPDRSERRRLDLLALLRWTLPTCAASPAACPAPAGVGAGDPMWRGGLSGPRSVFLHASRPLISRRNQPAAARALPRACASGRAGGRLGRRGPRRGSTRSSCCARSKTRLGTRYHKELRGQGREAPRWRSNAPPARPPRAR